MEQMWNGNAKQCQTQGDRSIWLGGNND